MTLSTITTTQRRDFVISFIILIVLLTINFFSWQISKIAVLKNTKEQFNEKVDFAVEQMNERIQKQIDLLENGSRFFISSDEITRNEFATFFGAIRTDTIFHGTQAIVYIEKVHKKDMESFLKKVREDKSVSPYGYPFFNIQAITEQEEHLVLNYIEPFEQNKVLFGHCVSDDPVLMSYFDQARDTRTTVITPEVIIMNAKRILFIHPVYNKQKPANSLAKRKENIQGYLVSIVKGDEFFDGVLNINSQNNGLSFGVYEGEIREKDIPRHVAFYEDSNETESLTKKEDLFTRVQTLHVGTRKWTVFFSSNPNSKNLTYDTLIPDIFFFGASGLSFLMFLLLSASIQHQIVFDIPEKPTKKN